MNELKPCPFCGGEAYLEEIEPHAHKLATFMPDCAGSAFVFCSSCSAAVAGENGERAKESAIKEWNRRVQT